MAELIYEAVLSTVSASGRPHIAPMGVRYLLADAVAGGVGDAVADALADRSAGVLLMPFKPSTTLDNIIATGHAVLNIVIDVRVFAGCVTGRHDWPTAPAERMPGVRLLAALSHQELRLVQHEQDAQRPRLRMACMHQVQHAPFIGMNRAQAAVLEAAVLVSRLHLLPAAKVASEMAYLQIAIDKTAGPDELQAWGWLSDAVAQHRAAAPGQSHRPDTSA